MRFRKNPVEFEAVQFTGSNFDEVREFTGTRTMPTGDEVHIFNPIGTFLPEHLYNKETNPPTAELWVDANHAWLPFYVTEWVVKDQLGFYPCKNEIMEKNNTPIFEQEDPAPALSFESRLAELVNEYSLENESGTPDFILAAYMDNVLNAFDTAIRQRANWRSESVELPALQKLQKGKFQVPITVYIRGRQNDIGEAEIQVWPGEAYNGAKVTRVIPIFEYDPDESQKYPGDTLFERPERSFGARPEPRS